MPRNRPHHYVDEAIRGATALHAEHYRSLPVAQMLADRVTFAVGRPLVVFGLVLAFAAWLAVRWILLRDGHAFDAQLTIADTFATMTALVMTVLILATENRQNELLERRAQLTLQMVLVTEQKLSKVLELLERTREERGKVDPQAQAMTKPIRVHDAIEALDEAHQAILDGAFRSGS